MKYHEGFWIQCPFTDNHYLMPNLVYIVLGSYTRLCVCVKKARIYLGDFNNHALIRCYRSMPRLTDSFTYQKTRIIQIGTPQYFMLNGGHLIQEKTFICPPRELLQF